MRLMVYSHDTFGLGNIRRMLAICEHLRNTIEDLSILIVSGSPMLQSFRVASGIDYIKLPCLKRSETGELGVRFLPMQADEIIRLRRELLLSTVISFKPDVVMVDKKPDGLAGELEPALRHIQCSLPNTLVTLVLRDILDSPDTTIEEWTKRGYHNILHWYYDKVLVLGSRDIFDVCAEYQIPNALSRKFIFCGYVARNAELQDRNQLRAILGIGENTSLVMATAGGGEDGFAILLRSIEAAHQINLSQDVQMLVVTGPEMLQSQRAALIAAAAHGSYLKVVEFLPDMLSHMHASDVVVSMGGYNSICELATLSKHAVIVPRQHPVQEQALRMERMSGHGPFALLAYKDLQSETLAGAIVTQLQFSRHSHPMNWQLDMGALARISDLLRQRQSGQNQAGIRPFLIASTELDNEDGLEKAAAS
jgi:predicted glycosyltransferase